jgi:hypothetical protein
VASERAWSELGGDGNHDPGEIKMRKWTALIGGFAVVALTGTALALTGAKWTAPIEESAPTKLEAPTTEQVAKAPSTSEAKAGPAETSKETLAQAPKKPEQKEAPQPTDTTPPELKILHPIDGQVFETKEVVFQGITEPGARVFAGKYEAEVQVDGTWRVVLYLSPGGNKATFTAKDAAGNETTASVTVTLQLPEKEKTDGKEPSKDTTADWKFSATQVYGSCAESPPYDVFRGTGKAGTAIFVKSEFGGGATTVSEQGKWELKVFFEDAPVGKTFTVKVKDEFGNHKVFEFTRIDG